MRQLRRQWRSAGAVLTGLAVLIGAGWALSTGTGAPSQVVRLTGGGAWVASPEKGYLSLIDGPSEQVVATVTGIGGPTVSVTQDGSSALLADSSRGTVRRIDGGTYQLSAPQRFGDPGASLFVLVAGDTGYVINAGSRVASVIDPQRLTAGATLNLAAAPGDQQTLVTDSGRLWVVDGSGAGLWWADPTGATGRADADAGTRLLSVHGRPVWVGGQPGALNIGWLDDSGGHTNWPCALGLRADDRVQLLGAANADQVVAAVSDTGTLLVADAAGAGCDAVVPIGTAQSDFGALVQSGSFVFVPDRRTGSTVVVDLRSRAVVADLALTDPEHNLQLISKDGIVFYNDLDSEKTGVIKQAADGTWAPGTALQKYDPASGAPISAAQTSPSSTAPPETSAASSQTPVSSAEVTTEPTTVSVPVTTTPTATSATTTTATTTTTPRPVTTTRSTSTPPVTTSTTTSTSTTPPPPVINAIVASRSVAVGKTVHFTADVTGPAGSYTWSATESSGGTVVAQASYPDGSTPFDVGVPLSNDLVVVLIVGNSAPFSQTFPITLPTTSVSVLSMTTAIFLDPTDPSGCGYSGCIRVRASTLDEDGNPLGGVAMEVRYPAAGGGTTVVPGTSGADGVLDLSGLGADAATGDLPVEIAFVDAIDLAQSSSTQTVRVDYAPTPVSGTLTCVTAGGNLNLSALVSGTVQPGWRVVADIWDSGSTILWATTDLTITPPAITYQGSVAAPSMFHDRVSIHIDDDALGRSSQRMVTVTTC